jgi:MFS family permease
MASKSDNSNAGRDIAALALAEGLEEHRQMHSTDDAKINEDPGDVISTAPTPTAPTDGSQQPPKPKRRQPFSAIWIVIACGFALMSDGKSPLHNAPVSLEGLCGAEKPGYLASVGGTVNTILGKIYPDTYPNSNYSQNITSIVFAGTVLGQLSFGIMSDKLGRKFGMISATIIVVVFSILSAGAWGAGPSVSGMLAALAAYRFLLGIGIGAEYPAGSVAASEATSEAKAGHRHMLFVMVTNFVIDFGFVLGGFVPLVLLVPSPLQPLPCSSFRFCSFS